MKSRTSIEYRSTRERSESLVEITNLENGELTTFKPQIKLGAGSYGMVRLFSNGHQKIAVKSPHTNDTQELNRLRMKNMHRDAEHEYQLLREAYPDEYPFFLTHFEGKAQKQYFHDYRMVIPFFSGIKLTDIAKLIDHTIEMAILFLRITCELQRLHSLGILHGDVSENNILVDEDDNHFIIHFIDFGLAYRITEFANLDVPYYGYLAPERLQKEPLPADPSQDVYSLAGLFNRLLDATGNEWKTYFTSKYPIVSEFITRGINKNPNERDSIPPFIAKLFCQITNEVLTSNQMQLALFLLSRDKENSKLHLAGMKAAHHHSDITDLYTILYRHGFYDDLLFSFTIDKQVFSRVSQASLRFFETVLLSDKPVEWFFEELIKQFKPKVISKHLFHKNIDGNTLFQEIAAHDHRAPLRSILLLKLIDLPASTLTDLLSIIPSCSSEKLLLLTDLLTQIESMQSIIPSSHESRFFEKSDQLQLNKTLHTTIALLQAAVYSDVDQQLDSNDWEIIESNPLLSEFATKTKAVSKTDASHSGWKLSNPPCLIL